jgi:hypothetical protein
MRSIIYQLRQQMLLIQRDTRLFAHLVHLFEKACTLDTNRLKVLFHKLIRCMSKAVFSIYEGVDQ